jgi:hypothetical protein
VRREGVQKAMKRTVEIDRGQCGMFSWRQTVKSTDLVRLSPMPFVEPAEAVYMCDGSSLLDRVFRTTD